MMGDILIALVVVFFFGGGGGNKFYQSNFVHAYIYYYLTAFSGFLSLMLQFVSFTLVYKELRGCAKITLS